jgi:diadenosine tetraphosphatase ApaH/serine/threonine PP2A family protein phosphatase
VEIPGLGDVLFCHATPTSDTELFTRLTPDEEVTRLLDGTEADLLVCGHTHMQFDRRVGEVRVVNAGSVGMPFGETGAFWLLLGPDVRLRRTRYDLEEAARRMRATAYPGVGAFVDQSVLNPPTEARMLEAFGGGRAAG